MLFKVGKKSCKYKLMCPLSELFPAVGWGVLGNQQAVWRARDTLRQTQGEK
jgi:hypothetical protein